MVLSNQPAPALSVLREDFNLNFVVAIVEPDPHPEVLVFRQPVLITFEGSRCKLDGALLLVVGDVDGFVYGRCVHQLAGLRVEAVWAIGSDSIEVRVLVFFVPELPPAGPPRPLEAP